MPSSIAKYFSTKSRKYMFDYLEAEQLKPLVYRQERDFVRALKAVKKAKTEELPTLLAAKKWTERQATILTIAAIQRDDPEVFNVVLDKVMKGNPNREMNFVWSVKEYGKKDITIYRDFAASYAVYYKKEKVAMVLAEHRLTDLFKRGSSTKPAYPEFDQLPEDDSAFHLAQFSPSMWGVYTVMNERLAAQAEKKAKFYRGEAARCGEEYKELQARKNNGPA